MSAHTPGPWHYEKAYHESRYFVGSETHFDLAVVADEPDARLIAAAPALLEALEAMVTGAPPRYIPFGELDKARAAIRAAKGETAS